MADVLRVWPNPFFPTRTARLFSSSSCRFVFSSFFDTVTPLQNKKGSGRGEEDGLRSPVGTREQAYRNPVPQKLRVDSGLQNQVPDHTVLKKTFKNFENQYI